MFFHKTKPVLLAFIISGVLFLLGCTSSNPVKEGSVNEGSQIAGDIYDVFPPKDIKGEHAWVFKINIEP